MKSENECKISLGITINSHIDSISENQVVIFKVTFTKPISYFKFIELLLMETYWWVIMIAVIILSMLLMKWRLKTKVGIGESEADRRTRKRKSKKEREGDEKMRRKWKGREEK